MGDIRRRNRRYHLRPMKAKFIPVIKAASQRKVKLQSPKSLLANSQEGFPQFPRLPQELRLKIWDVVTDEPRAVAIRLIYDMNGIPTRGFRSPTPVPAALHVCMESRETALKKYELSFSGHSAYYSLDYPARIWFNFEKDMVYFRNRGTIGWHCLIQFQSSIVSKDLERIQFLGIDIENTASYHYGWHMPRPSLWPAPHLHESWLKVLTGLKAIYHCHESGRVNIRKPLTVRALEGNKERDFVRHYRWNCGKDGRFKGLSVSAALEKIKSEVITFSGFNGLGTPEVGLATVANS
jgi:hypothetical protein